MHALTVRLDRVFGAVGAMGQLTVQRAGRRRKIGRQLAPAAAPG